MCAFLVLLLFTVVANDGDDSRTPNDKERLQGVWQAVSLHANGAPAPDEIVHKFLMKINGDTVVFNLGSGNRVHTFTLVPNSEPKAMDLTPANGPAKGITLPCAIYKIDGDRLAICICKVGPNGKVATVRPRDFKDTTLGDGLELIKLERLAMTKIMEIRDHTRSNVMAGRDLRDSFHTLRSINDLLGEQAVTNEVFAMLDEKSPELAKDIFDLAKPSLLRGKSYAMLGKYVEPKDYFAEMRDAYRKEKARKARTGVGHRDMAKKQFANDAMRLVAILSVNGRGKEAEEIAALARAEWDNRSFRSGLRNALEGIVPDPLP